MNARFTVLSGGVVSWAVFVLVRDGPDATLPAGPVLVLVCIAFAAGSLREPRVPVTGRRAAASLGVFAAAFAALQLAWGASVDLTLAVTLPAVALGAAATLLLSRRRS